MGWEEVVEGFVEEGREDHVGLWQLVRAAREDLNLSGPSEIRAMALRLAEGLLRRGVQAGFPTRDGRGFEPWPASERETLGRIDAEWSALGREPNIGEIVWFNTP